MVKGAGIRMACDDAVKRAVNTVYALTEYLSVHGA